MNKINGFTAIMNTLGDARPTGSNAPNQQRIVSLALDRSFSFRRLHLDCYATRYDDRDLSDMC
ncbi:hypothetical protein [Chamaesiphon minutus]|uniref:hypothetical protein n=1 Tax=Chamaesiphon minutus TaxID=1173032 RepID=UPI00031034E6|nr:hypothetical protein [Chamaesiphon minutus]